MKRTPQLAFAADPGVAAGSKVEEILRQLHEREQHDDDDAGA
jgi:ribosome-binding factor A